MIRQCLQYKDSVEWHFLKANGGCAGDRRHRRNA
jgi:hypothetical protein